MIPINGKSNFDPLAIGFDIETGGHVFPGSSLELLRMNERAFYYGNI